MCSYIHMDYITRQTNELQLIWFHTRNRTWPELRDLPITDFYQNETCLDTIAYIRPCPSSLTFSYTLDALMGGVIGFIDHPILDFAAFLLTVGFVIQYQHRLVRHVAVSDYDVAIYHNKVITDWIDRVCRLDPEHFDRDCATCDAARKDLVYVHFIPVEILFVSKYRATVRNDDRLSARFGLRNGSFFTNIPICPKCAYYKAHRALFRRLRQTIRERQTRRNKEFSWIKRVLFRMFTDRKGDKRLAWKVLAYLPRERIDMYIPPDRPLVSRLHIFLGFQYDETRVRLSACRRIMI